MQIQLDEISLDEIDGEGAPYKATETRNACERIPCSHSSVM